MQHSLLRRLQRVFIAVQLLLWRCWHYSVVDVGVPSERGKLEGSVGLAVHLNEVPFIEFSWGQFLLIVIV